MGVPGGIFIFYLGVPSNLFIYYLGVPGDLLSVPDSPGGVVEPAGTRMELV